MPSREDYGDALHLNADLWRVPLGSIAGGGVGGLLPRRQALSDRGRNTTSEFCSAQ